MPLISNSVDENKCESTMNDQPNREKSAVKSYGFHKFMCSETTVEAPIIKIQNAHKTDNKFQLVSMNLFLFYFYFKRRGKHVFDFSLDSKCILCFNFIVYRPNSSNSAVVFVKL